MERLFKIKKGLNINLDGVASQNTAAISLSEEIAVQPTDFYGLVPHLEVKEGDRVKTGTPLFTDKATGRINICSPVSGTVKAIVRGERRKILRALISTDKEQAHESLAVPNLETCAPGDVLETLLKSGLFAFFRQRPYDIVASPDDKPKAIFVSAFSKMPLAADFSYVVKGQEDTFKLGIKALAKLAKVHLGICLDQINTSMLPVAEAEVSIFDGPNPSGNVGVQINHIDPVNKGEVVWTMGPEEVIFVGRLFKSGKLDLRRRIAIAGSGILNPQYAETLIGTPMKDLLARNLKDTPGMRIIDGNPLVGTKSELNGFLGAHTTEVCVIPEGNDVHEMLGWIMPRTSEFSANRSYLSWIFGSKKSYDLDCRIKGGERAMIMSGEYDKVFPMDIYAGYLVKAIIAGDIDRQEALGIYEVAPEDFAVAEFVDSSKLELQHIVRQGLDILRKENA